MIIKYYPDMIIHRTIVFGTVILYRDQINILDLQHFKGEFIVSEIF